MWDCSIAAHNCFSDKQSQPLQSSDSKKNFPNEILAKREGTNCLCFVANWTRRNGFMLLEKRLWWDFKAVKSRDRLLGSALSLQCCKALRAMGKSWSWGVEMRWAGVWGWFSFDCFWAWNIKVSISKVFLVDFYLFPLKSMYTTLLKSVGAGLNQFCKSQPCQSLQMTTVTLKLLAWGNSAPSGTREYCPEWQISLFSSILPFLFFLWFWRILCDRC